MVSVIIPVYNSEKYINRCLTSLLNQTYKNIEIIIINDGSTDNGISLIEDIKDNRVKIINKENSGVSDSRNLGIKLANGKYIVFVDSDDYVEKSYIEDFILRLKTKEEYVLCGVNRVDKELKSQLFRLNKNFNDWSYEDKIGYLIQNEILNAPFNKIYLKKILIDNKIFFEKEINIAEDLLFNFKYIQFTNTVIFIDKNNYNYVIENSESLSRKVDMRKYEQLYKVNKIMNNINCLYSKNLNYIKLKNILSGYKTIIINRNKIEKKDMLNSIYFFNIMSQEICEDKKNFFSVIIISKFINIICKKNLINILINIRNLF